MTLGGQRIHIGVGVVQRMHRPEEGYAMLRDMEQELQPVAHEKEDQEPRPEGQMRAIEQRRARPAA
jgi:hypothetical protein